MSAKQMCYMKVEGCTGDSQDKEHKGWFDVHSHHFGVHHFATVEVGGGGYKGKASIRDLQVTTNLCDATTSMMKFCANGKTIPKVTLEMWRQAGDSRVPLYKWEITNAIVTSYSNNADGDNPTSHYAFNGMEAKFTYTTQSTTGGAGPKIEGTYNQNTAKVS